MAAASQAASGEFDSRRLLQKRQAPKKGACLFWNITILRRESKEFDFLTQGAVYLALGHRSRSAYALTHLAPKRHYQCLFNG